MKGEYIVVWKSLISVPDSAMLMPTHPDYEEIKDGLEKHFGKNEDIFLNDFSSYNGKIKFLLTRDLKKAKCLSLEYASAIALLFEGCGVKHYGKASVFKKTSYKDNGKPIVKKDEDIEIYL